jgi:hypothetical protein
MTVELSPREAEALRRSLTERITTTEPRYQIDLLRWLRDLPDDALVEEARVVQAALSDPRTANDGAYALTRLLRRPPSPRLTPALRAALLSRVTRKEITDGVMFRMVDELLDADEETCERRAAELLVPSSRPSFAGAHTVLVHALRAAPTEALPPGPFHRGEPRPFIGSRGYALLGITLARSLARDLTDFERETCNELVREVLAILEGGPAAGTGLEPPRFDHAPSSLSLQVLSLLASALKEARLAHTRPDTAGTSMRSVVARTVKWLSRDGPEPVRAFLITLDEELRRLDVVHALYLKKKTPSAPITRALWRGGTGNKVLYWLALLEGGRAPCSQEESVFFGGHLGLLSKIGSRWTWTEGSRDDVLATIPDDRFEEAVLAAVPD